MTRLRLTESASVIKTPSGARIRSDLGTLALEGDDVARFISAILPLLDGSRDEFAIADALPGYTRDSVADLLGKLHERGLLELVEEGEPVEGRGWGAQFQFLRTWSDRPREALEKIRQSRVLVIGLEPWGAVAAVELAASGVGAMHLLDDLPVTEDD